MKKINFYIIERTEFDRKNDKKKKSATRTALQSYKNFALLNDQTFYKSIYQNWKTLHSSGICSIFWIASHSDNLNAL